MQNYTYIFPRRFDGRFSTPKEMIVSCGGQIVWTLEKIVRFPKAFHGFHLRNGFDGIFVGVLTVFGATSTSTTRGCCSCFAFSYLATPHITKYIRRL
jgi:hypothetical protein